MKKIILILALLSLSACTSNQGVTWIGGTFSNALEIAKENNKPLLIDFYSDT